MSEFGIEISQSGVPVDKAGDTQKVLDSRWEYLNIEKEASTNIKHYFPVHDLIAFRLIDHSLGYLPAFTQQITRYDVSGTGISIQFFGTTTSTYAIIQFFGLGTASIDIDITVRIFDCDITREYKAPIQKPIPVQSISSSTFGAKIISPDKSGIGINDSNIDDYSLHIDSKSICIQQHGLQPTGTVRNGILTVTHNFGTPPAFAVAKYYPSGYDGGIYGAPIGTDPVIATINSTEGVGTVDGKVLSLGGAQYALTGSFAYILFKDPLDIAL